MRTTIILLGLLLAGCGTDSSDRVQGGAATGAATGGAIGIVGGPIGIVVGALIGGGAGAITGATTKPDELNLGQPLWDNPEVKTPITN